MAKIAQFHGSIPMKPYLKQFVLALENKEKEEVIDLKTNTFIANLLNLFLTGKTSLDNRADMKDLSEKYTESLRFSLPYRSLDRGRICITPQSVVAFNKLIYDLFHETLLNRILFARKWGLEEIIVIEGYLKELGIEPDEDIELASVKKASYRRRKIKNIEHFYSPSSREQQKAGFQRVT